MRALSILQPWAWLIVRPDITDPGARAQAFAADQVKIVENRDWRTDYRGPILIHAGRKWSPEQRDDLERCRELYPDIAFPDEYERGGFVGAADIVDCVDSMDSRFFFGEYGFVLANNRPIPKFIPYRGQLGIFHVPREALAELTA